MSSLSQIQNPDQTPLTDIDWQPRPFLLNGNETIDQASENIAASPWSLSVWKRLLDIIVAISLLTVFALPALIIAFCVLLSSRGPVLFIQKRVGRFGREFDIYKFRSMRISAEDRDGPTLTRGGDSRITATGRWLRKLKLDEIPQMYNVLRGDMSLIGPRPKLLQYAESLNMPYRPGITGAATLAFRNEEEILRAVPAAELEMFYELRVKPTKARIDADYMRRASFWTDAKLVAQTFIVCLVPSRVPAALHADRKQVASVSDHDATNFIPIPMAASESVGATEASR